MSRLRFACVLMLLLIAASAYASLPGMLAAPTASAAPALQATPVPAAPSPVAPVTPQSSAPIGEGTQQVLLILGFVVLSAALIAVGIYFRRRWMATRY